MAIQLGAAVAEADFAWLVGSICQINRIPFDPALLLQRFSAPHSIKQFVEAAHSLGFRTGAGELSKAAFPCVGFLVGEAPRLSADRKSTRLNSSHTATSRMPSSA